ncbi:MAG: ribonuclease D [Halieaceae bacterium]|nr:ribonuclease D [Halieaceae bacterium]
MAHTLVESDAGLAALVEGGQTADAVMVDTEFMRRDTFFPQAALVQLCFSNAPEQAWLVDPLAVSDMTPLKNLFANPAIVKVLHSPSEDLEVFQCFLGVQPLPLFDTQRAAAFAGLGFGIGYRPLVEKITGEVLDKGETRSDWLRRPLTESQQAYAAADVLPLLAVYRHLRERLDALDRSDWVFEDSARAVREASEPAAPAYLRIKSAWKLSPQQLAVLAAVCDWREQRARQLDKPRSWILPDKVCFALAQRTPANAAELRGVPDMPQAVARKQGEALLDLISDAGRHTDHDLPEPPGRPLDAEQRARLKAVKQKAAELARAWQVEPEALLSSKDYELMVRLQGHAGDDMPDRWSGWRREALIEPLLAVARGQH